jgi:hypothetical protein
MDKSEQRQRRMVRRVLFPEALFPLFFLPVLVPDSG